MNCEKLLSLGEVGNWTESSELEYSSKDKSYIADCEKITTGHFTFTNNFLLNNCVGLSPENGNAAANSGEIKKEQIFIGKRMYTEGCPCYFTSFTCVPIRDYSIAFCVNTWDDFFSDPYPSINLYVLCKQLVRAETEQTSHCHFYH